MKPKAVLYCRVSSREQEEAGYSLPAQEELLRRYATACEMNVANVFSVAESASGARQRQVFTEMIEYMRVYDIKIVICEKADRLTRNFKDAVVIDDWIEEDAERQVHLVKDSLVLHKGSRSQEKLNWGVRIIFAKNYIDNLSEEVKKGQMEKIRQGWLPTKPPLGYKTVGDKGHKIHVLDAEKAPFILRAFELYASGNYSLMALRDKIHTEGFRTRAGSKLSKSRLADILRDPFYAGSMRWNDVVYAGGAHEPLISQEVFKRVQDMLTSKTTPHYRRHQFQFSKKMMCGECEGSITAEIQKGIVYYHCNHYRNCSQKKFTPEKQVEEQLFGVFKFFENITTEEAETIKAKIKANHGQEIEYKEATLKALNERYGMLQRRLDHLYDDRLDERISPEFWGKKQKEIVDEQNALQGQIQALKSEEARYFEIWLNILDLARRAREIYERRTPEERRLLLSHIFSNLMLKDEIVSYTLKAPVQKLAERVQERLDAEKSFELQKTLSPQGRKGLSGDSFQTLLRTWDEVRLAILSPD